MNTSYTPYIALYMYKFHLIITKLFKEEPNTIAILHFRKPRHRRYIIITQNHVARNCMTEASNPIL